MQTYCLCCFFFVLQLLDMESHHLETARNCIWGGGVWVHTRRLPRRRLSLYENTNIKRWTVRQCFGLPLCIHRSALYNVLTSPKCEYICWSMLAGDVGEGGANNFAVHQINITGGGGRKRGVDTRGPKAFIRLVHAHWTDRITKAQATSTPVAW